MTYTLSSATPGTILEPTGTTPNDGDLIKVTYEGVAYTFTVKVVLPENIEATSSNGSQMLLGVLTNRFSWKLLGVNWR